ncbi:ABC transporter family substrate-binding protein [Streptomyces acidicola]|uniref:ABC transporter family substrate-binding protein n=1 Tax=Streptomyces acidicola TaxID=2596892 RepID=UPI00381FFC8D
MKADDRVGPRAVLRSVAFLAAGVLVAPVLTACSEDDPAGKPLAGQDIAPAERKQIADGGTLRWAVDAVPETLNVFQADADAATTRVAGAVLPSMYRLDANGRPERNADYLESAEIVEREPKQVVLYKLHQQAVWSDGREIGAADFASQWRALSGKNSTYWTARNAGYDRIEKIERGANDLEVRVTFKKPYADWKALFTPLYPKEITSSPDAFNDGTRRKLKLTAGPFALKSVDRKDGEVTLARNPLWWGRPAKLKELVLRAVPRDERAEALADGKVDVAEVDAEDARRIDRVGRKGSSKETEGRKGASVAHGPATGLTSARALHSWAVAHGSDDKAAEEEAGVRRKGGRAISEYALQQSALRGFEVRKSLEPAYTQLALNGAEGPLTDERVRRAVARALNRKQLADVVLKPLGLPPVPVGSHVALAGQAAYADNSGALGGEDTKEAKALLADAGWVPGGPVKKDKKAAGAEGKKQKESGDSESSDETGSPDGDGGTYVVGEDNKSHDAEGRKTNEEGEPRQLAGDSKRYKPELEPDSAAGMYAPEGTAAPGAGMKGPLAKDGKALSLRFVLPSGPGSESLRAVGRRIARMLERVGIRTEITKVPDTSYFKDHIANGQYDLALYSWPASAYPATDARPIYAKPVPGADGSLTIEQNYTRVGTDQVDQLFDQAISTLDEKESRSLIRKADARIWAAAGSIPLYQRPQLVATRTNLANVGAFGFETPVYEDMGFLKKSEKPAPSHS